MHSGKFFLQMLEVISKYEFNKCVKHYKDNRHIRELDYLVYCLYNYCSDNCQD